MRELSGVGIRGEAEFFRRVNNRTLTRQKRIRIIQVRGLHMILMLIVLGMGAMLAWRSAHFLFTWKRLEVQSFHLVNPPHFERERVHEMVKRYRGNILALDFQSLRRELLQLREVRSVSLTRRLPSTVEVGFELRTPVFQFDRNGQYSIIDRDGVVLQQSRLPLKGLITVRQVEETDLPRLTPYLAELERVRDQVEYVGMDSFHRVVMKWRELPELVYPPPANLVQRLRDYTQWKKRLKLVRDIRYVDLRFENRFYFAYRQEA
ncbi:MAG: hypothetical protein RB296_09695 [Acidobacteriota bacterium]|jgi:cell division septal protein FtsQ|nr:hypothetical protein [Acidobacteriota bacterium]